MQKRIAIPCTGEFLNEHFGRAQTFKLIEIVDGKIQNEKTINSRGLEHQHEGIAQLLKQNGVETVICGGIGAGAKCHISVDNNHISQYTRLKLNIQRQ